MAEKWIQKAVPPSHKGLLTKRAEAAGESLSQFMAEPHKSKKVKEEVNFARTMRRLAKRK